MNYSKIEINKKNLDRFQKSLSSQEGKVALKYLSSRNISGEIIFKFQLGWGVFDDPNVYMRDRITVPLNNIYGETLAFAGRIPTLKIDDKIISMTNGEVVEFLDNDGKRMKNKLTWWHEPLAKRNFLYGLDQTWEHIREENAVVVVEGEFDLWACYQNGIKNVVAILGSSFTLYQIGKLLSFCDNIIMMLDSDHGGNSGWERSLAIYEKYKEMSFKNFNLDRLILPDKYDPFLFINEYGSSPLKQSYNKIISTYCDRIL